MITWPDTASQSDRIEAMLVELLRRLTPAEALPAMMERMIAGLPNTSPDLAEKSGWRAGTTEQEKPN